MKVMALRLPQSKGCTRKRGKRTTSDKVGIFDPERFATYGRAAWDDRISEGTPPPVFCAKSA